MKGQGRSWKLKRMAMDTEDTMQLKKGQQAQADRRQQDLERFMQVRWLCQAVPANGMCSCICCCIASHQHKLLTRSRCIDAVVVAWSWPKLHGIFVILHKNDNFCTLYLSCFS